MKRFFCCLMLAVFGVSFLASCGSGRAQAYHSFDDSRKNIGIYLNSPHEFLKLEEAPDIYPWFEYWYGHQAMNKLRFCRKNPQYTPMITWMPTNISLAEIAEGKHDEYIKRFLGTVAKICSDRDILIRFAHEMELRPSYGAGWYTWQRWGGERTFKAAWIHVVTLGREIDPGIKWIWAPNRADEYSLPYYPGDEYVDYVGLTLNHASDKRFTYKYFEDFYTLEATKENLEAYGKKIIICELAYSCTDPERRASYYKTVFDYYQKDDRLAALVFFNEDKTETRMFRITDDERDMQIFCDGIRRLRNEKAEK